ncbi:hypothetical protein Tco_1360856 [Tanacetum coccineum]
MLDKAMYNSWESHMLLYIKVQKNSRMMLESIENGPLVYPTVQATNIVLQGDHSIACLNKSIAFMSTVVASRFPSTNNQLRTYSNPRNQASIQDDMVTVQQVQGRQAGQARIVKCYNYQGERHMARQCTKPNRLRNSAWFKEKMLLVQAQESGQVLDEEKLAFLVDPGITDCHDVQPTIIHNAAFHTDDLDAYDSDYDDISSAKAVLMDNFLSYDSDVLSEVPQHDTYQNDNMLNQSVQETPYFEQSLIDHVPDNEITSDSNIISYEQYLQQTQNETKTVNESLTAELERYKERVKTLEQRFNVDLNSREKLIDSQMDDMIRNRCALKQEIDSLKQTLSNQLNKLAEDFGKRFVPQMQLSAEQAFWLPLSNLKSEQLDIIQTPVEIEIPKELPKISSVKTSFQKLKNHLASFDKVVKVRTTPDAITERSWGFEHTKKVFKEEVIPFINSLWVSFKDFEIGLHGELNEVKMVFNQMEAAVDQCSVDTKYFDIQKKEVSLDIIDS